MTSILIVEDNPDNRELLAQQLGAAGYEVVEARDGIDALEKARAEAPDLVLSDLLMPRMDGFMLVREWRADALLRDIPFLVYTATFTDAPDERLARDLGADDFLVKPMESRQLLQRVEAALHGATDDTRRLMRPPSDDTDVLAAYNERLGRKLQHKIRQLDRTRQALTETDELYSSLFRNNHLVMLLVDPETGRIVDANPAAAKFYGWSRDELLGFQIHDINALPPDEVTAEMSRASREKRNYFLFRHRLADGSLRDVEVYSGPIAVRGRHLLYSIVHDITERRETERRLQRTQNLLRIASSAGRVGGWEVDVSADRVFWSDEVCRIHGLPVGTTVSVADGISFYAPEYRPRIREVFEACARDGVPYDEELQILRADGRRLWVRTIGEPMRDDDGKIYGVHGAFQEIEEQRTAQEQLRQLWLAVEQSPESILITDHTPAILYVNDAACRISGYSRKELLGSNPSILASGKTPRATYAAMWQSLRMGQPWSGIFHNRRKDGREYVESVSIGPVRQPDGKITHYLAVKEDITDKRETERELKRYRHHLEELVEERTRQLAEAHRQAESANEAKSSFLARMSHEIRTPMNGVLGTLDILQSEPLTDNQAELVATVRESGRALMRIIDDILDFSRIEAGRLQLERAEFSLTDAVEGLCGSLVPLALEREVDLHCFVSPTLPSSVVGDEVRLRQILANLVGNAIKFSGSRADRKGRVTVRAEAVGQSPELAIEVEDNGIGISEEAQKRLFQPFSQAEESTTRRFGGSGLGLVIAKRLTDLMDGSIGVESRPGEGSLFRVRLPLEPAVEDAPAFPDLSGLRVRVLDDDGIPCESIERYLTDAGVDVEVVQPKPGEAAGGDESADVVILPVSRSERGRRSKAHWLPGSSGRLLLSRSVHRSPNPLGPHTAGLSALALRRRALLEAVAAAAGRMVLRPESGPASSRLAPAELPDIETAAARGELILVAEDDAINRKVIARQLQLLGRAAELACDGQEALEIWRKGRSALVLTDLHMPVMDGYALTEAIRREEATKGEEVRRTPVIALTANALRGEAERGEAIGLDDYVTKPVQLERLREVIDSHLPQAPSPGDRPAEPASREVAGDASARALDTDVLRSLIGDDEDLIDEFLREFLKAAEGLVRDLERACVVGDSRQVATVAHKLKSSSRSVGAIALGDCCASLEHEARSEEIDFRSAPGSTIRERLDAVRDAIERRQRGDAA